MFESVINFFKKLGKKEAAKETPKEAAKERLHLVLMQDRANVSADFLEMMKQEIIEVIKKYIDVDEKAIDVRLTNKPNEDGTVGAPALYANIPIVTIKNEARKVTPVKQEEIVKEEVKIQDKQEETQESEKVEKEIEEEKVVEENQEEEQKELPEEVENQNSEQIQEEVIEKAEEETQEQEKVEPLKVEAK